MKKFLNKKYITIIALVLVAVLGVTYAYFNYYYQGANRELIAGDIYLNMDETDGFVTLTNIFPETKEEARARTDNTVTFTIDGTNTTTNKEIWYEILLDEGESIDGKTRFKTSDLVFDLAEIKSDGTQTLLVDSMSFNDINAKRIWVDNVASNTTEFKKTYQLRVWLSDKVHISDTKPGADYPASTYKNYYASVKVGVYGDFDEKSVPYNYMKRYSSSGNFWPTKINAQKSYITEANFVNMQSDEIEERYNVASIKADLTDTSKSNGGKVYGWLENGELVTADDGTETQYYILYVASEGTTFFPGDCSSMFSSWSKLTTINFENVDTRYVTHMSRMFSFCSSLTSLDVSNFDTSQVTSMKAMFEYCTKLTSLDLSNFNTSQVTSMYGMFYSCSKLTSLDLSSFDTSKVTTMNQMFAYCSSLTNLDLSSFDTSQVTDMKWMFSECSKLTSLDVSNFDTSQVTTMSCMFYYCTSLTSLDLSNFNTSQVTSMYDMFYSCSKLTSLDLSSFDTSKVTTMNQMFAYCSSLTNLDLSSFDTSQVTDMERMFSGCSSLTSLDVSKFDTSQVTDMRYMFDNCSSLTSIDLSGFDTSKVTNMSYMFSSCRSLTNLDLSSFDTSQVTDMEWMFSGCSSLTSLDVSDFDTNQVTNMYWMFYSCSALTTIYANSDWNTTTVTSSSGMFSSCSKLVGAISYDSTKTDVTYANPTTGYFTVKPETT